MAASGYIHWFHSSREIFRTKDLGRFCFLFSYVLSLVPQRICPLFFYTQGIEQLLHNGYFDCQILCATLRDYFIHDFCNVHVKLSTDEDIVIYFL